MTRPGWVDHVRWVGSIGGAHGDWACLHCGHVGSLPWGVSFTALAALIRQITKEHRACPKPDVMPHIPCVELAKAKRGPQ